jgi:hypothetical protein
MKILWLGLNPSKKNTDPTKAFLGTPSYKRLKKWQSTLDKTAHKSDHVLLNISHKIESDSQAVKEKDLSSAIEIYALIAAVKPDIIVGLGERVSKRLKKLNIEHRKMPHPSPRNRIWNNKYAESSYVGHLSNFIMFKKDQDEKV